MTEPVSSKFVNSDKEFRRALQVVAEGTTQTRTPAMMSPCDYPAFGAKGDGACFWDIDGHRYIDWILSFGCIVLGHNHPEVNAAAIEEINKGFTLQLPPVLQTDLAEKLVEIIPCAEKVLFLKTGSGATSAAVRVARLATGRDKVIRLGYNGWHDWCCKFDAGIPQDVLQLTKKFEYNDLESLADLFRANPGQVACVIMWACEEEEPHPGFLEGVRDLAHENGALFVLDEVRTGFHLAMGGAQQYFEVTPDLATFGKAMANGFPLSVLAGPAKYMDHVRESWISSTHCTNAIEYAAALATIRYMEEHDVIGKLWDLGRRLIDGQNALAQEVGVEAETIGLAPTPNLVFRYPDDVKNQLAKQTFYEEALRQGVFFHPNHHWFISAAHGPDELSKTLQATEAGFRAVQAVV